MQSAATKRSEAGRSDCLLEQGFEILTDVLPPEQCELLANELSALFEERRLTSKSKVGGVRNLLRASPRAAGIARSPNLTTLLQDRLNKAVFPVRALFFDKTPDANWQVPWHQDLAIALAERIDTPGFDRWSVKEGVTHVQPPRGILEGMAVIRLHLDDCDESNGALRVIPGSHIEGELNTEAIDDWKSRGPIRVCEVRRGGVLLMRPLLLHASSPARNPSHRRVLHIEYATDELPNGLKWFDR